jgi:hypothetical protein
MSPGPRFITLALSLLNLFLLDQWRIWFVDDANTEQKAQERPVFVDKRTIFSEKFQLAKCHGILVSEVPSSNFGREVGYSKLLTPSR